jgi:hypothetical protein
LLKRRREGAVEEEEDGRGREVESEEKIETEK